MHRRVRAVTIASLSALGLSGISVAEGGEAVPTAIRIDPCEGSLQNRMPESPTQADRENYRASEAERALGDWPNRCRYHKLNQNLTTPAKVVFIGDSISQFWAETDTSLFSRGVVGRGISGQTTPQVLLRFYPDVVALSPKVVHIMVGTNDIAGNTGLTSLVRYQYDIKAMVTLARANKIRVVLGSIPPAASFWWRTDYKPSETIRILNAWLRRYARDEHVTFIDYHQILANSDGSFKANLSDDGVHPNKFGYELMSRRVRVALKQQI